MTPRETLLSKDELPVITDSKMTLLDVILRLDRQHLVIAEEAADGFRREYERVNP